MKNGWRCGGGGESEPSRSLIWPLTQDHSWTWLLWMHARTRTHAYHVAFLSPTDTHLPCSFTSTPNHTVSFSNTHTYTQVKPKHTLLGNQQDSESCLEFSESIFRIIKNTRVDLKNLVFAESLLSRCGHQLERVCLRKQEGVLLSLHWDKGVDCQDPRTRPHAPLQDQM